MIKSIEETYQKKTHLEQILLRPDTYIGSVQHNNDVMWVWDPDNMRMIKREISFVPGLWKIFDEILVNASDNKQRDPSMTTIRVTIDPKLGYISVFNNGRGIPVVEHEEHKCFVPELIFGHLLTSSNYDDQEQKTTGGRNGYGAKLTNIFSNQFMIETYDSERNKEYKQVWENNMTVCHPPTITSKKNKQSWTKVTFAPDLSKFNMTRLDKDIVDLLSKRVVDICGTTSGLNVYLNGNKINLNSFSAYVKLYFDQEENGPVKCVSSRINDKWQIAVCPSDGQYDQVSFVNGISTSIGGTHVKYISNQISRFIITAAKKKNKRLSISANHVKAQLFVFVNCLIVNPTFDSQSKVNLTTQQKDFGSKCVIPANILNSIARCGVLDQVLAWSEIKDNRDSKKTDGRKSRRILGVPKLEDANFAGTAKSSQCTLILTEGDSAKALAMSGLSVVGRDYYGVYPLRGKFLNVRNKSQAQINSNGTIATLKNIIGLQSSKIYQDVSELRYGHVMIMADQDHDGSHIKGLVLNLFQKCWNELFKMPSFLQEFITPIVKCKKGQTCHTFFTLHEYETWKSNNNNGHGWNIKYYKGLATSTAKEGQEYFKNLSHHKIDFVYDSEQNDHDMELVFDSKLSNQRKTWLGDYVPGTFLDQKDIKTLTYSDFVNKELIQYSMSSNIRSCPSIMDGLKPGQRKIMHACFQKNINKELKVAQLSGHVMGYAYHHGDASLNETIVGLAQDFVGSNNINLLVPCGQFGTRHAGGKNHSSARYIFTHLEPITRQIFHPDDDQILNYLNDDGLMVEPEWFAPVIPMVLVNGAAGIGTGWSTNIPNFNPRDIIKNIKHLLHSEPLEEMVPWYNSFTGQITKGEDNKYHVDGKIAYTSKNKLVISELPIGSKWTDNYKVFLESLVEKKQIKNFSSHHSDNLVHFEIDLEPKSTNRTMTQEELLTFFKLKSTISMSNMVAFGIDGSLQNYASAEDILTDFYHVRLKMYQQRKVQMLSTIQKELQKISNKVRFILAVINQELEIRNIAKNVIYQQLKNGGYDMINEDYHYLLSMPMWNLTLEKVQQLTKTQEEKKEQHQVLSKRTIQSMWIHDLDQILLTLDQRDIDISEMIQSEHDSIMMSRTTKKRKRKAATKSLTSPSKIRKM